MNEYQLIEYTSMKSITKITSYKVNLNEILLEVYQKKFESLFDAHGKSRGFISIFINSKQLFSIKDVVLKNADEILLVSAISGG